MIVSNIDYNFTVQIYNKDTYIHYILVIMITFKYIHNIYSERVFDLRISSQIQIN